MGAGGDAVKRVLDRAPLLAVVGVVGLAVTSVVTSVWTVAKTVQLVVDLLDGGWRDDASIVDLLVVVEGYLLAVVQVIIAVGLYELFVGDLDVPDWLVARSFDDLKAWLVDSLVVFVAIKGVERLVATKDPMDALTNSGAVAILLVALTIFRLPKAAKKGEP
jgi:uncharacterized membrane protein YqhA